MFDPSIYAILDAIKEYAILVLNENNEIVLCNKAARFLANRREILGLKHTDVFPFLKGDQRQQNKIRWEINGKEIFLTVRRQVISNGMILVLIKDITSLIQLSQRHKKLVQAKKRYEYILETLEEGVIVTDENGNIVYINTAQEQLDRVHRTDFIGKHVTRVYNLSEEGSLLMRALKTGIPVPDQHQFYINMLGQAVNIVANAMPLLDERNRIIGAVSICRDTTRAKELAEKILHLLDNSRYNPRVEPPLTLSQREKKDKAQPRYEFKDIIGTNYKLQKALHWAKMAAGTDSSVLIYGPTGTGKELFAQSIHNASRRRNGPFVAVNCAALPETLLESILFGTVKGAFTGAVDRPGLFEQANGGTLFLDELNSMPLGLQAKLLRVLQEGTLRRVGGTEEIPISVRIISSINIDPQEAVAQGLLRADLFYRIAVVTIGIPALYERKDDIPQLVSCFIDKFNHRLGRRVQGVTQEVMDCFMTYDWPGNVRELEHIIECCMNLIKEGDTYIRPEHLPSHLKKVGLPPENQIPVGVKTNCMEVMPRICSLKRELATTEKDMIIQVLHQTRGNISQAARMLGISRQSLQYRLRRSCRWCGTSRRMKTGRCRIFPTAAGEKRSSFLGASSPSIRRIPAAWCTTDCCYRKDKHAG